MAANERELATLTEAVKTLSSEVGGLRGDFKEVMSTQVRHSVEISDIKEDVKVAHSRVTTVSTRLWAFAAAIVLMAIAGVVKAGTNKGGPELDNNVISQLLSGDWQSAIAFIAVAILNIGVVAGARSWAMAKGREFLSSGRAAWIFVFIVCLLEKLLTGHLSQLGDPAGLLAAIQQSIADASAATVGVLAVHTTGKTAIQGVLRAATINTNPIIPCGISSGSLMQSAALSLPVDAGNILDVLNALDTASRDKLLARLAKIDQYTSTANIKAWLHEAIDKIPTKWGSLGAFLFRLLIAPRLYKIADQYVGIAGRGGFSIGSELQQLLGGSLAVV